MRRAIVVILDGLRRDFVTPTLTPRLAAFRDSAEWFATHRSVAPSVTRVASSSVATGSYPGAHGIEGNALALTEKGRLRLHDVGRPEFFPHRRCVTGRALDRPTMAERLAEQGGTVVYSNVSPGAAYAHDPDGHGHVFHRAGSYGPGRTPLPPLPIKGNIDGDRFMTERFLETVLSDRAPVYGLIWMSEPDTCQHALPLGSHEHLEILRAADANAGRVIDAIRRLRDHDDVLLAVGSDHGHQTVTDVVDVAGELDRLGFSDARAAGDLVVAPNGTAALIYASARGRDRVPALAERLANETWAGDVVTPDSLAEIGHDAARGLALYVSMAASDAENTHGVPGLSHAVKPLAGKSDRLGCGQHGGLGRYEQSPFLMIEGDGFRAGATRTDPTSLVDLAPTILAHLDLPSGGMSGRALSRPPQERPHTERTHDA